MKNKKNDISFLGMEKGLLYETIITSKNSEDVPNAAPIGVLCKSSTEIVIYLHEGSHTLKNIRLNKRFAVNILKNPELFVKSTISDLSLDYFKKYKDIFVLEDAEGFFTADLTDIKEVERKDKLGESKLSIIQADVKEVVKIKECVEPLNRAIFAILESLIYLTRLEIANQETYNNYTERIKELSRLVHKVGGSSHKQAMKSILESINNKK
ncbi:MAG: DUF447 domain-containing protein [Methanomicrobiales archaeon]